MSQRNEPRDQGKVNIERGLEALRQSSEFRGPVEPLDDHTHANDHFALIYETQEEQFAAAVPFMRQGLERGERCLYITYENSREEILEAMRADGIDVDAALESGAFSIHTAQDSYLRNGTFDPDDTIAFLDEAIEEATEEYEALRVTGEMSSVLEEDPDGEDLIRCEAKANYLFDDVDGIALCQYNCARFSPEIIHDVISTHPHIIHGNRVSHNVYYTPPEEFFGPEKSAREVDRMMGTLRNLTEAKTELQNHKQAQRTLYEIVAGSDRTFEEKLQALFDLGCERLGLELGGMACVDPATDRFEVEVMSGDHEHLVPGAQVELSESYCRVIAGGERTAGDSDSVDSGFEDTNAYEEFGRRAYLRTHVEVDGDVDRILFFVSTEPRDREFSDEERTFHRLMGQWVEYELERRQAAEALREHTHTLETINEVGNSLAAELDLENLVQEVTDAGTEITDAEFGAFFYNVIDDQGESYTLYTISGVPDEAFEDFPMPRNTEVFGPTFHGEGVVRSDDITKDPRYGNNAPYKGMPEGHLPVCSYLAVPVISNSGEVHGGLFFGHSEPGIFTEKDENIITGIAAQAAVAIDNARLYETVRESEERFRALVSASSDVVYRMSSDWSEMYYLEGKEFIPDTQEATNDWLDKYIHPDDQERVMEAINEAIQTKSIFELESQVEQVDGSLGWTYWRAVPMLDEDGIIDEWIGMARDITERKEYEQELEQTNAQLERSNERLERSNTELKRFAYAASHDLQEPLRMVSSYLQLLEHRYTDDLDADAQDYIEFAVDGADRMREMIDALLKYSRLDRDGDEFEPVDCAVVLREAMGNLQIAIEENDAEITSDSLPTVMGDKQQLVPLFQNLLDNAITYAGDEPPRIHVTAEKPNDEWVLSVRDNGIGIDPDKTDGIFRVFNRLHTTDEFAGTGIGLALCQRIVDIHDGRIWVDSKPGEGSTFSFTVPDAKEYVDGDS
ncbi:MEDS domain-containing protein [Haloprofundus salinisoli]|uniref:MEDS domain-containing protein n=1 Tax=Haloprofundus salinisoli TaxID=2876193 RepID=UPI001CCC006D|nr:MEDS domain-containing protein [Haloprofundus salinisoli]